MDNVFVVVYEEGLVFQVLEVFKTRESAETYILNFPQHNDNYSIEYFQILEKKLWE